MAASQDYSSLYICLSCFHRRVSSLGGGLHVDSGSSQVSGGGRGRLSAQSVSPDRSDCRNGGHLHQPRYSEAGVNRHLTPRTTRPRIKDNIFYHTLDNHPHLSYNACGLILPSSYMLTYNTSHTVAPGTSRDFKPTASTLLFSSVLLQCVPSKDVVRRFFFFQIKLDRDNE